MRPLTTTLVAVAVAAAATGGGYAWYSGVGIGAVTGGIASLLGGARQKQPERPPPIVVVGEARRETVTRTAEAVGTAVATESVTLTAQQPGRVVEIAFTDGQRVEKGEVLVRLDRQIAEAELGNVEAEAKQVEQELERGEFLLSRGTGPRAVVEDTQRRLQAARARVESARKRLEDTLVRAPFDGRVGLRDISVGAVVERNTTLATVDAVSPMDLRFTVPEQLLGSMRPGTRIEAATPAYEGRAFEGEVKAIGSRVDPATRTISVEARLPNPDGTLLPGMLMNVRAVIETIEDAVVVPPIALLVRGAEQFVYVLGEGDKADRKVVRTGQRDPQRVHVVEGLRAGDRIIVEGVQNVTDGQKVRVKEPAGERPPDGERREEELSSRRRALGGG